jgi:hypothetical protein
MFHKQNVLTPLRFFSVVGHNRFAEALRKYVTYFRELTTAGYTYNCLKFSEHRLVYQDQGRSAAQ